MSGNTNTPLEVTEKTCNDIDMESKNEQNGDFNINGDINDIYKHFDNDTMTKEIFTSFIDKINTKINDYKRQLESYKTTNNKNKPAEITSKPSIPTINVSKLIESAKLITTFSNIQGCAPKAKLSVSFYPQFVTIISQKKHDQHSQKTLINYSDIDRIICVPEKNDDTCFFIQINKKIPLNWRKSSKDCFAITFEHSSDYQPEEDETELKICNLNTTLPALIKGNLESQFCRIISGLTNKNINRHDKNLFKTTFERQNLFYIDATIKFNKICVYPLRCGIFIAPKPLRFVPQTRIKYYEYPRHGDGLRYFDLDIVLFPLQNEAENDKKKTKKKGENMISLTMIAKSEMNSIDYYFNCMNIKQKQIGKASPERKLKINNNNKQEMEEDEDENMSLSNMGDNEQDLTDSDDEDYKIEEDDDAYSDSDESDVDSDMNEVTDVIRNCEIVERGESIINQNKRKSRKQKSPKKMEQNHKKINRKRKREEMESESLNGRALQEIKDKKNKNKNKEIITIEDDTSSGSDDFDILSARKRFKGMGRKAAIGRKSSAFGQKGSKIVSKSISKKKSVKKVQNKDESVEIIESPVKKKKKLSVSSASSVNSSLRKIKSKVRNKKRKKKKKKEKE